MVTTATNTVPLQLLEEIRLIPQDKLPELTRFVHIFRLGLEASVGQKASTGQDMPDHEFQAFLKNINEQPISFTDSMAGLFSEVWDDVDPQAYIDEQRASWD